MHDSAAAVAFLAAFLPEGPWLLVAIPETKKRLDAATFLPGQEGAASTWIEGHNGRANLYFHVNPTMYPLSKKAEREDIKEVRHLHVDIDPRADVPLDEERERITKLLQAPPSGIPLPTFAVFSGGGVQAYWRLAAPIPIDGSLERAMGAALYNRQLELEFRADHCHNIDRLMRLPGTINLPDAKKRKRGRVEALAELIWAETDRVYPITMFRAAAAVPVTNNVTDIRPVATAARLRSVDDLSEWNVPDRVRVIVVQGAHPDEMKPGDGSRSAWLFDAVCALVRCSVPDDVIFSIITDADFGISESVLDKGTGSVKYAQRQIERAKEHAASPHLRDMNERHAVIGNWSGRCRVVEEVMDYSVGRSRLTRQTFEDLRNRYMNVYVEAGRTKDGVPIMKPLGAWWLAHPMRRQYDTVTFAPGRDVPGSYNLWRGFSVEPTAGGLHESFLEHVRVNVCNDDRDHHDYLVGWMARAVQHPDTAGQVAIVLRGKQGVGKSFFARAFGSLFGRHFLAISDSKHLVGSFNAHLRDVVVLFGDEAFYANDKRHESVLKTLITEESIVIEAKGVDAEMGPNYTHVLLASNSQWVVPAGADERRFFVLDVADGHHQDAAYFGRVMADLDGGGRAHLLDYLMRYSLDGFDVRKVPKTDALMDQKIHSLGPDEEWWFAKLVDGTVLPYFEGWPREVLKSALQSDYVEYMRAFNISRRGNSTALGRFLARVCPDIRPVQKAATFEVMGENGYPRNVHRRAYHYALPRLNVCREAWDKCYGAGTAWPEVIEPPGDLGLDKEQF